MEWQSIIISIVGTVLTALATFLANKLAALINSKVKNAKIAGYLHDALGIVSSVVKATYQTYVQAIKGTDAWTAEVQKNALKMAVATAKTQLSKEVQDYIKQAHGSIENWLTTQIEAEIYTLKVDNKT